MLVRSFVIVWLILTTGSLGDLRAQDVQVSRTNKTVEVTVTEFVEADPEIAVIHVGYQNYGRTKEGAFEENVTGSNRIVKSLLESGISKDAIYSERISLSRASYPGSLTETERVGREFEISQVWGVSVPVAKAQEVATVAVRAGANQFDEIEWRVRNYAALESKANTAALSKARALAAQMVGTFGGKLGDLLYVSNSSREARNPVYETINVSASLPPPPPPNLQIFPRKVRQEATVHIIFAFE